MAAATNGKPAVKTEGPRTVAVLPFTNTSGSKNFNYLNESIPEAIITSIAKLKRFQIVERQTIKALLNETKLEATGLTETGAREVSKQLKADIYIIGSFLALENQIQINARIFSAGDGRVLGAAKNQGPVSSKIFQQLDELAEELAESLDKAVPRDRVITQTRVIEKETIVERGGFPLSLQIGSGLVSPLGELGKNFQSGFQGDFALGFHDLIWKNTYLGLVGGFALLKSEDSVAVKLESLNRIPLHLRLGYDFFPWKKLNLRPYISGGVINGQLKGEKAEVAYTLPEMNGGLEVGWFFGRSFRLFAQSQLTLQFDEELVLFNGFNAGASYRF